MRAFIGSSTGFFLAAAFVAGLGFLTGAVLLLASTAGLALPARACGASRNAISRSMISSCEAGVGVGVGGRTRHVGGG
jgi:hypothetical protein